MNKEEYKAYLQSNHWKNLRRQSLERSNYRCDKCGSSENLEVHHLRYRNIYNVTVYDLETVCSYHHKKAHGIEPKFRPIVIFDREQHEQNLAEWLSKSGNKLEKSSNKKLKTHQQPAVIQHRRLKIKNEARAYADRAYLAKLMPHIFT